MLAMENAMTDIMGLKSHGEHHCYHSQHQFSVPNRQVASPRTGRPNLLPVTRHMARRWQPANAGYDVDRNLTTNVKNFSKYKADKAEFEQEGLKFVVHCEILGMEALATQDMPYQNMFCAKLLPFFAPLARKAFNPGSGINNQIGSHLDIFGRYLIQGQLA